MAAAAVSTEQRNENEDPSTVSNSRAMPATSSGQPSNAVYNIHLTGCTVSGSLFDWNSV
jgi:hypothetical protein